MTPGERILELFATLPPPGSSLDWWVDGLMAILVDSPAVTIRRTNYPHGESYRSELEVEEGGRVVSSNNRNLIRLFRPLLARLSMIGSETTGKPFQPYSGSYFLERTLLEGTLRFDVTFSNTLPSQQITFIQQPALEIAARRTEPTASAKTPLAPHPAD
jgi:hypothetical protein